VKSQVLCNTSTHAAFSLRWGDNDLGYRMKDRIWFPAGAGISSLRYRFQTGSGAHRVSYSPEVQRPGREAEYSPQTSAEVKNIWGYTSIPPYVFMAWCLFKHRYFFMTWYLVKHRGVVKFLPITQDEKPHFVGCPWLLNNIFAGTSTSGSVSSIRSPMTLCVLVTGTH